MKKKLIKILNVLMIICLICTINVVSYAHQGKTDSNGGHRDKNNKSGLGSYHYHCGGYPAHLHENGTCPYEPKSVKTTSSNVTTSNSKKQSEGKTKVEVIEEEPKEILPLMINIKYNKEPMKIGTLRQLTVDFTPSSVTNKNITWESSDTSIVSVDEEGKVRALSAGTVEIKAIAANEVVDVIEITVEGEEDATNAVLGTGVVGGVGYLVYKKRKKLSEENKTN